MKTKPALPPKISEVKVWADAHVSVPDYQALHDWVSSRAGEGEEVTPEMLGLTRRSFCYDRVLVLRASFQLIVYSMDKTTGEIDVELIS